ncbi:hypothetical protein NAAC61_09780 [Petrotoga sp. 8T1HF07.NaAc.6.1]|uniref:YjzC family protein n=1 Tax=Petrotoga sp. 8T1HF07.NaAc.6.1 TaxID=1351838 RepID=UPI00192B0CDA|nr:YjzC family protein [Petrotoga sp. 8T1HF07.NaAc.6.1]MBL5982254.1 hypothetical protein [Petrotoga sp. 8T1HF07.NaAc.6.1]
MPIGARYRTGQRSPANAYYKWVEYTDGTRTPLPTNEEMKIHLETDETFPPINSCDKGAIWEMTSYE